MIVRALAYTLAHGGDGLRNATIDAVLNANYIRKGRGVMTTKPGVKLAVVREIPAEHDHVAVVGDNRKLVLFSLEELPVLAKGQGVTLQRYRRITSYNVCYTKLLRRGEPWMVGMDMMEMLRRSGGLDAVSKQLGISPAVAATGAEVV